MRVGTVRRLAMEVDLGLKAALPKLRKTVVRRWPWRSAR